MITKQKLIDILLNNITISWHLYVKFLHGEFFFQMVDQLVGSDWNRTRRRLPICLQSSSKLFSANFANLLFEKFPHFWRPSRKWFERVKRPRTEMIELTLDDCPSPNGSGRTLGLGRSEGEFQIWKRQMQISTTLNVVYTSLISID